MTTWDSWEELLRRLVLYPLDRGDNAVIAALDPFGVIQPTAFTGDVEEDFSLLAEQFDRGVEVRVRRQRVDGMGRTSYTPDPIASIHITRLTALDEIRGFLEIGESAKALRLALHYELVTSVSGAVVLETDFEYESAGIATPTRQTDDPSLQPHEDAAEPEPLESAASLDISAPPIPEPSSGILFLVGLLVISRRMRPARRAFCRAR
jgi:hypothetical protein